MDDAAGPPRKIVWCATTGFSFGSGGKAPPVLGFGSKRGALLLESATRIRCPRLKMTLVDHRSIS